MPSGPPPLIDAFNKVRNHFGMNRAAQAGALAALGDQDHLRTVLGQVEQARARIAAIAKDNGLVALPSATNFVALDCRRDGAFAKAVLDGLIARGIFAALCIKRTKLIVALNAFVNINDCEAFRLTINALNMPIDYKG